MTEREQFIRAICEEPWRDDVRLVYSDWLEERGEAERAEFIKTQIELEPMRRVAIGDEIFRQRDLTPRSTGPGGKPGCLN